MGKSLYIAEKPSVAQEFAKALKLNTRRQDGYLESEDSIVTWGVEIMESSDAADYTDKIQI